ncbi:LPXTG cell wall anchor domain-containing protein [Ruminococcaceae bacterium OttesenSCG-928-I18]|nr:LPXTG cell wall anchor domain-containing protein [Ruminococcaceae bacterium OttesenSCG-928-I18]
MNFILMQATDLAVPQTGDNSSMIWAIILIAVALLVIATVLVLRAAKAHNLKARKERDEKDATEDLDASSEGEPEAEGTEIEAEEPIADPPLEEDGEQEPTADPLLEEDGEQESGEEAAAPAEESTEEETPKDS